MSYRKEVDVKLGSLTLSDRLISYRMFATYLSSVGNEEGEFIPSRCDYLWIREREEVCSLEMYYENKEDVYDVVLEFKHIKDSLPISFKERKEAAELFEKIKKWWLGEII